MKVTKDFGLLKNKNYFYKYSGYELFKKESKQTATSCVTGKVENFSKDDTVIHVFIK